MPDDTTNGTGIKNHCYRNDCGIGNLPNEGASGAEDCSLDMISSVASAFWIRWMLVSAHHDEPLLFIARGAPRRWFQQTDQVFGIDRAPTRFGQVTFAMQVSNATGGGFVVAGSVALKPPVGAKMGALPTVAVHIRSPVAQTPVTGVAVVGARATLSAWHASNETAVFTLTPGGHAISGFTAKVSQLKTDDSSEPSAITAIVHGGGGGVEFDGIGGLSGGGGCSRLL